MTIKNVKIKLYNISFAWNLEYLITYTSFLQGSFSNRWTIKSLNTLLDKQIVEYNAVDVSSRKHVDQLENESLDLETICDRTICM
jgi:hypothetical protein